MKTQHYHLGTHGYIYFQFLSDEDLKERENNTVAKLTAAVVTLVMFGGIILEVMKCQ